MSAQENLNASQFRVQAWQKLQDAERERARAHRKGEATPEHDDRVQEAYATVRAATGASKRDPFAGIPGADG